MADASRKTQLADAAITTLAQVGSRGLTHRAVDRAAGVSEGSTSYYFRTRASLLAATVGRLAELDTAAMLTLPAAAGADREAFACSLVAAIEDLQTVGNERLLARYELAMEATRRPELSEVLAAAELALRAVIAQEFAVLGVSEPDDAAHDFLILLDGVLFSCVTGGARRTASGPELHRLIRRLLDTCGMPTPPSERRPGSSVRTG